MPLTRYSGASGLLVGLLQQESTNTALAFAVAVPCLKQTMPGGFDLVGREEVDQLAAGGGSGRVEH